MESVLNEMAIKDGRFTAKPYSMGGLPDMSGSSEDAGWETPPSYYKAAHRYYGVIIDDNDEPDQRTVIFVKIPTTMDKERVVDNIEKHIAERFGEGTRYDRSFMVTPELLDDLIMKNKCTWEEYQHLSGGADTKENRKMAKKGGYGDLAGVAAKAYGTKVKPEFSGTRSEVDDQMKAKAKKKAMEKKRTMLEWGYSEEEAHEKAKEAYKMFLKQYREEQVSKADTIMGGHVKAGPNPTMKNVRGMMDQDRDLQAKKKAAAYYRQLVADGTPEAKAKAKAREMYQKLTAPIDTTPKGPKISMTRKKDDEEDEI